MAASYDNEVTVCLFIHYPVITLSMLDTASVAEESASVQVCATLSDVPAGGYVDIDIVLATSDSINI